ncbi:unnamed protein product [Trichogramma brassicae]|uniref:Uncharacterized protein n=1 Tax=Trichogramma brassicae TaxID=86971 RepID=A0A6H5IXR0_9HYME|nr:unnamed protein product [Trichogramma brassicae]
MFSSARAMRRRKRRKREQVSSQARSGSAQPADVELATQKIKNEQLFTNSKYAKNLLSSVVPATDTFVSTSGSENSSGEGNSSSNESLTSDMIWQV